MKNIATPEGEKINLSFAESAKGNKKNNKRKTSMKRHILTIMKRIVAEHQREYGISSYQITNHAALWD